MTSTMRKTTVKLPRLRMKDELLKTSPDLARLLNEELPQEDNMNFPVAIASSHQQAQRSSSPRGARSPGTAIDTPRIFEDEILEDEEIAIEMDEVKKERTILMQSIAHAKQDVGMAGGEAQQLDIKQLVKEMESKKQKLNELKQETRAKEEILHYLKNNTTDCKRMMPTNCNSEVEYIQHLKDELKKLDDELVEAEAKNRLYFLLGERTRQDHMAMEKKVHDAREMKKDCKDDIATLTQHMHDIVAAKEEAEKQLSKMKKMYEEARHDWRRKLKDRRREVRDLKKRQAKDREKEASKRKKQSDKEAAEQEFQAKLQREQQAYDEQIQALAPKIEAMQASWNRLRTISGADSPAEVIGYWEGLKAKEENMRELVKLAEKRESKAKLDMADLLQSRSEMFEVTSASSEIGSEYSEHGARIKDSKNRMNLMKQKFHKLSTLCISAEQGLSLLNIKLMVALEEAPPSMLTAANAGTTSSSTNTISGKSQTKSGKRHAAPKDVQRTDAAQTNAAEVFSSHEKGKSVNIENPMDPSALNDAETNFFPQIDPLLEQIAARMTRVFELKASAESENEAVSGNHEELDSDAEGLKDSELELMKGLRRHTWTGPPWLDNVTEKCESRSLVKRLKGKKKKDAPQFDLTRILGYAGDDLEEADSSESDGDETGGVVDREFIKHRSMKMTLKLEQNRARE